MVELSRDLRQAARTLGRDRRFTTLTVLTLGMGIGMNAAVFTVFQAVLLTPPPYPDPDRLVVLWSEVPATGVVEAASSYANVADWRARSASFEHLAVFDPVTLTVSGEDVPVRVSVARISANLFAVLGAAPQLGRGFTSEEVDAAAPLAVVSHAFAQARFGDASDALGRSVVLDGASYEVIGVMAPDFGYPSADTQLWLPATGLGDGQAEAVRRGTGSWRVLGRLRDGVTLESARAELSAVALELSSEHPENAGLGIRAVPLHEQQVGTTYRSALWTFFAAVGVVLLIACANAAHLALIRGAEREGDRAIRTALGASRARLVRQALAESLLLAGVGGIAGAVLAAGAVELLVAIAPPEVLRADVRPGFATFAYVAGLSSVIGVLFGVAPALLPTRGGSAPASPRVVSAGPARRRGRDVMITAQLALALVLLFGASLLVRSLLASMAVDPGFDPEGVVTTNLSVPSPESRLAFYRGAVERAAAIPGVRAAGLIEEIFITGAPNLEVTAEGGAGAVPIGRIPMRVDAVAGDVFDVLDVPLVAGRPFAAADGSDTAPVAIVNETMARRLWGDEPPIGRRFRLGADAPWVEVVGLVGDMRRQGPEVEPIAQVFRPYAQAPSRNMNLLMRTDLAPEALGALLRARLRELDPTVPVYAVAALSAGMDRYVAQRRLQTFLFAVFSGVALLLAAVGVYGSMRHSVSGRTREIGVRVALGARSADVARMILGEGMMLTAPGIALGLLGAVWAADGVEVLLYRVGPSDPRSLVVSVVTLTAVMLLASYLPARRAAAVEPTRALRGD